MTAPPAPLHFVAFVMNTASHSHHGQWRHPESDQIRFNELDFWVDLAKHVEAVGFDLLFFADVVGLYHEHRGDWAQQVTTGRQLPVNDPLVILSALASHTEHLGLAFTAGPIQQPPFNFARQVATLDHATKGRIAWNIVTGYLENGWRNYGHDGLADHGSRYERAAEYVDVLYKLWEGSWDDGALLQDRASGRHADPAKVHKIDHVSEHYRVEGPFMVAPSPQRTPLLFQAGSSPPGRDFAARHAEAQFILSPNPDRARELIDQTRGLAVRHGRRRGDLRFFQGLTFVVGSTEEEARRRGEELDEYLYEDGEIASFGGALGFDFGAFELDTPIQDIPANGLRSQLAWLREANPGRNPTLRDVIRMRREDLRVVGTPEQIADHLAHWSAAGVDGINVTHTRLPGSFTEFGEHVLPVLRERGLAKHEPTPGTLRNKLFGADRLSDRHPAARHRGAFAEVPVPAAV